MKLTLVDGLVVWNFRGWNVGTATDGGDISDVLIMDLPSKRDAVALASAHAAGRIDLAEHSHFDHDARVAGSRGWGGYAAVYAHTSRCSCGWSEKTDSKLDGRRERAEHLHEVVSSY